MSVVVDKCHSAFCRSRIGVHCGADHFDSISQYLARLLLVSRTEMSTKLIIYDETASFGVLCISRSANKVMPNEQRIQICCSDTHSRLRRIRRAQAGYERWIREYIQECLKEKRPLRQQQRARSSSHTGLCNLQSQKANNYTLLLRFVARRIFRSCAAVIIIIIADVVDIF